MSLAISCISSSTTKPCLAPFAVRPLLCVVHQLMGPTRPTASRPPPHSQHQIANLQSLSQLKPLSPPSHSSGMSRAMAKTMGAFALFRLVSFVPNSFLRALSLSADQRAPKAIALPVDPKLRQAASHPCAAGATATFSRLILRHSQGKWKKNQTNEGEETNKQKKEEKLHKNVMSFLLVYFLA